MAEDEDLLAELEGAEAAGGKKPIGMIIGIIVGLLILGGGGYYAYINFFKEKPAEVEETKEVAPVEKDVNLGVMFPLDPFVVNLAGSEGKRFLKVTISLELSAPEVNLELKENIQKILILIGLIGKNGNIQKFVNVLIMTSYGYYQKWVL